MIIRILDFKMASGTKNKILSDLQISHTDNKIKMIVETLQV